MVKQIQTNVEKKDLKIPLLPKKMYIRVFNLLSDILVTSWKNVKKERTSTGGDLELNPVLVLKPSFGIVFFKHITF